MGKGRRTGLATLAALSAFAVLAGCNGTGESSGGPSTSPALPTTAAPTTTLSPEQATEAAVLDAYRRSWDDFIAVASDANAMADDPRLAQHTAGNSLLARQASVVRLRSDGRAYRGQIELHPEIASIAGTTATVRDCNIDRTSVIDVRTGQELVPPSTQGAAVTAVLRLEGAVWKQVEFTDERRSCVPGAS